MEDRILVTSYDFKNLYELKKQNPNILRGFITLQQDLSRTKKNIYEGSPWMAKSFPIEDLFLLPKPDTLIIFNPFFLAVLITSSMFLDEPEQLNVIKRSFFFA